MPDRRPPNSPEPPYWAVIFTSRLIAGTPETGEAYARAAARMETLVRAQPGFLGMESVRQEDGTGVTVSCWRSAKAIAAWRDHPEHVAVRKRAGEWYDI